MVKGKKGKKDVELEESSDVEIKQTESKRMSDDEDQDHGKKAGKKGKKEKKKASKADNSDDDQEKEEKVEEVTKKMEKMNVGGKKGRKGKKAKDDDSDDNEAELVVSQPAFALLGVDSDGSDDDGGIKSDDSDKKPKQKKKANKKQEEEEKKEAGGKKSKKAKKKKDEDDDDIDAMLAELEAEYSGVKKDEVKTEAPKEPTETKKDKKDKKKTAKVDEKSADPAEEDEPEEPTQAKTATEKKRDKKQKKKQQKDDVDDEKPEQVEATPPVEATEEPAKEEKEGKDKKKKKKGKAQETPAAPAEEPAKPEVKDEKPVEGVAKPAEDEAKETKKKKGPGKAMVAAMQERLKKIKEEEERLQREEEERIRRLEEAEKVRLEKLRLEQEKKEKKKQKEKERKEKLKAEGKLLTAKQKADKARAQAMIESLKAQGVDVPEVGEKRARPGTRIRPNKNKKEQRESESGGTENAGDQAPQTEEQKAQETEVKEEVIKDAWDESSSEDESGEKAATKNAEPPKPQEPEKKPEPMKPVKKESVDENSEEESSEEESESESEEESSEEEEDDRRTDAEKMRDRAQQRINKRLEEAEKKKTTDNLRASVVCVLGHVDTGKTKILDKLRRTNVQDAEAGGITQQIGATNVPIENIKENTKFIKGFNEFTFKLPGLLIIDTPGHESFSNLRSRGSSLCDIAILVVDIMHGLEPQTIESLNLLKKRKTPFVVALNKIDRLYDWQTFNRKDVRDIIKLQASNTQLEFQKRTNEVIVQFAEQSMNAALFYENPDQKTYISLVPTSAITGEGMGNLLFLIIQLCQNQLAKRLMYSEALQATVLEVKAIPGLGTTIDAILVNGKLREGDTMIVAGTEGPIVTPIKALLMPQPMKELRVKNAYIEYKEVLAAQGVKIAAKELEKAIAGINLQVAQRADEIEIFKEIVAHDLKSVLRSIKLSEHGVFVQASTLGSLEALLEFLKTSKIPYAGIRIGPVVKRDVMKASIMLEHEAQYATILAFDVKIERDAQELADNLGVKIFQADIIYHLFDKFIAYRDELKQQKRDEFKSIAVFPCKLKILPQFVFNSRDPIVMGVMVEAGIVKEGTPICVPSKEFVDLGIVTSIENNHKNVESARKGQEVCIKIEPLPGESPKMFGRHFDDTDMLVSKISRQSIDACKDYFRDDLVKADWNLMVELKKTFQIL